MTTVKDDVHNLIDLLWTNENDNEVVEKVISFLSNSDIENWYKVDLLMDLVKKYDYEYYSVKKAEYEREDQ